MDLFHAEVNQDFPHLNRSFGAKLKGSGPKRWRGWIPAAQLSLISVPDRIRSNQLELQSKERNGGTKEAVQLSQIHQ